MEFGFRLYFADKTVFIAESTLTGEKTGNHITYKTQVQDIRILWKFEKFSRGMLVTLEAESDAPLNLNRVDTLCLPPQVCIDSDRVVFFTNNCARSGNRYPSELGEGREYYADCTGLFCELTAPGLALATVAPYANIVGACAVRQGNTVEFSAKTEFTEGMKAAQRFISDRVVFAEQITIQEFYDIYRELLPKSSFPMPKLTGWNTWDYYLDRITPEDIFENIDALARLSFADKLNYIVLDDGWQKDWGVWTENEKFSCGLEYIARRIIAAGFRPGIWMAPLLMKSCCEGFDERQEWLLKKENGEFLREIYDTYVLDPTHPQAREFVLNNYKYLYSCGYRLFKIDYLSVLLSVKDFHDPAATPYSALADLIRDVKDATGPDAVILGCSLPVQCGADIAQSMRIGVDIHNHFSHVQWIAQSLSWTWMYNNRVTRIDPDFIVVRGEETANEPLIWEPGTPKFDPIKPLCEMSEDEIIQSRWRYGHQFNALEAETWANLVAMTGGNLFLSDRMSVLNEKGLAILERAFDTAAEDCRPYFLPEDARLPSLWQSENTVLVINWTDERVVKTVDCLRAVTSNKDFVYRNGKLTVRLQPHESFLATFE